MINRVIFTCWFYILGSLFICTSAQVRFTHYSTENGLPNDFVLSIVQDQNGFIWFGTHLGVVRYDGHSFNLIQPDPQKSNSLSYKHVNNLYGDSYGNLWIRFTENALNRLHIPTGEIINYPTDTTNSKGISSFRGIDIFEDVDSVVWLISYEGIFRYNSETDEFKSVLPGSITSKSFPSNKIATAVDDSLGNLWVLTTNGIGRINRGSYETISLGKLINQPEIESLKINALSSDRKSTLWFSTINNGLYSYDILNNKLKNYSRDISNVHSIFCDNEGDVYVFSNTDNTLFYIDVSTKPENTPSSYRLFNTDEQVRFFRMNEDKAGNIWISSSQGLDMFNKKSGIVHYKHNPIQSQSISSNVINFAFIDQTNNLWLSNYRKGLDKADLNQKPFEVYFNNPDQTGHVFYDSNITSLMEDSQNYLWVGATGKSIIRFDRETNSFESVQVKEDKQTMFSALFEDSEGDIWVGNYYEGIERIDTSSLQVTYSEFYSVETPIFGVRKFAEDKDNNIWFVSSSGVHKWDRKIQQVIPYTILYDTYDPNHGFYRTLTIDKDGIIWAGSYNGGMVRYNTETKTVRRFMNIPDDNTSISGDGVYTIYEETDSTFLIGTTLGLNRFNKKTEQFSLVETKQSLYNYSIYTIIPDTLNNLWMATDYGLIRFNRGSKECTFFNEGDGLPANEFNTTASCLSHNGLVYLGSPKGMLYFDPNKFTSNPYLAKPTITNLQIDNADIVPGDSLNGRVVLSNQIWETNELVLKYDENDFTLQFSAMHFAVPENNKFWYKLEGYRKDWLQTDANRRWASYTGLQPGHYTFKLRATNNDGVLCNPEDEVSLKITIKPPFWMTLWFKILFLLLIIILVGSFIRQRIVSYMKSNLLLEQKVKERTLELEQVNSYLEEQQEEIYSQNETLRATKEEIIEQNIELDKHRYKLESLVEERTSELMDALNKARESDRLKSSFLANMSHEIRTPMNAIIGFSSLLKDDGIDDSRKNGFYDIIIKNSEALLVLIDDILDLSKIQSNQLKFNYDTGIAKEYFDEIYNTFILEAEKKPIDLKLNLDAKHENLTLVTDGVRFKQVISNLLSNAIKFTEKGAVEFGVFEVADQITFYVKDTGIGISENIGDSIFEQFLKVEENKDQLYRGVGLGLAICKSLVNHWGGRIWYESKENIGTTFYFTHPRDIQQLNAKTSDTEDQKNELDLSKYTLLIAEDEESNYQLLCAYLEHSGANILWAKDGMEACEMFEKQKVDLVLMDIKMPVMNGVDAAKILKKKDPNIPIIAQTAFSKTLVEESIANRNIDAYVTKPINRVELMNVLANYL